MGKRPLQFGHQIGDGLAMWKAPEAITRIMGQSFQLGPRIFRRQTVVTLGNPAASNIRAGRLRADNHTRAAASERRCAVTLVRFSVQKQTRMPVLLHRLPIAAAFGPPGVFRHPAQSCRPSSLISTVGA